MTEKKMIYRTVAGVELEYEPVSPLAIELSEQGTRKKYLDAGEPITPPTYKVTPVGGGEMLFEHDQESIKGDPEAEKAWNAYIDANRRLQAEIAQERTTLLLSAVKIELPNDDTWLRRQKRRNIVVPERPLNTDDLDAMDEYMEQLRSHYIMTEILKTVEDSYGLFEKIIQISLAGALTEEQISAASATFRSTKETAKRELQAALAN
jgi:hypothetical protein